ncbi:unnamed protein product [Caenorhabditis nigoni]
MYSWYGSVRFDTENVNIEFHTNYNDTNSTIQNNLPDPNQGFQNSSIGSNALDAIEKFFSNTQAPVCGSIIVILLKRYPNEADTSRLVSLIRYHHAIVHVLASATPSGGSQPKTMYSVASNTNGIGPFESDDAFSYIISSFPIFLTPYIVYATTCQVTGSGTISLPDFHSPIPDNYWIAITFQDHDSGSFDSNTAPTARNGGTYACGWNNLMALMSGAANYVCETYSFDTDNYCDAMLNKKH